MDLVAVIAVCFLVVLLVSTIAFFMFKKMKRYDGIDIIWGLMFVVVALTAFTLSATNQGQGWLKLLVLGMVCVWGSRLSLHIYRRFKRANSEDRRYVELRSKWPKRYINLQVYLKIFVVQAVLATIISLPVIAIMEHQIVRHGLLLVMGILVWVYGFIVESVSDSQLRNFIKNPANKNKIMRSGFWRYSRHPNYFGEIVQWWGIGLISLATTPFGFIGLAGPIVITYLIMAVSGVPLAENNMSKKPGWKHYKETTSVLIPLPPRRDVA